jgi:hypothetical protein
VQPVPRHHARHLRNVKVLRLQLASRRVRQMLEFQFVFLIEGPLLRLETRTRANPARALTHHMAEGLYPMGRSIRNAKGDSGGIGQDHEKPCDF